MEESSNGTHVTVTARWDTSIAPLGSPDATGVPVSVSFVSVYTVTDGKVAKAQNFYDVSQFAVALGTLHTA